MIASGFLPIIVMATAYYLIGIYPGSNVTILASDSFTQYSNFHASFNNVLHGKQNIFYTWSGSLGLNYWALMAYYLNGIFTPLIYFFENSNMADGLYFLTLIKFGASGVAFWIFAHHTFKLNRWLLIGLSVAYSLMAFSVGYSQVIMWLDTFVYLPLITLGIHRVQDRGKPVLLFISYLLLFLSNFYMAFMVGVFSFLYFWTRSLTDWKRYRSSIGSYLLTSLLAGGASMVTVLPAVIDLKNNGESLSQMTTLLTPDTGIWDFVAKSMVGVYDTGKYEAMPFIYAGLVVLLFAIFYFVSAKIPTKNKWLFGSLLLFLVASVYLYPLNLAWHGLHAPNMLLFRFSFLFSFLTIVLAGYVLETLEKKDINRLVNTTVVIIVVLLLFLLLANKKRYGIITTKSLIVTISLLISYVAMVAAYLYGTKKVVKYLPVLFLIVMTGEAFVNAQELLKGIKMEWNYPTRELITHSYKEIDTLTKQAEAAETTFYRLENLDPITTDDSFNFGYHGVSLFSSIRNRHSSQYLNALGFRSLGSNLLIEYANNTLLMDTLIGMKYNLARGDIKKFGYEKMGESGAFGLYKNKYALPLGILTDEGIYDERALLNQTELFNYLSGEQTELFKFGEVTLIDEKNVIVTEEENSIRLSEENPGQKKTVTWLVTVPAHSQGYLSIVPRELGNALETKVYVTVDGITRETELRNNSQYHNIGYYDRPTTVKVTTSFVGGNQETELYRPDAVFLDTVQFTKDAEAIQKHGVEFQLEGRQAKAKVELAKEQVLLTTIPYDKGWKAYIDGKQVAITTFKDAFLTLSVPEGEHTIEFRFLPQGFLPGFLLFGSCTLLFCFYEWRRRSEVTER